MFLGLRFQVKNLICTGLVVSAMVASFSSQALDLSEYNDSDFEAKSVHGRFYHTLKLGQDLRAMLKDKGDPLAHLMEFYLQEHRGAATTLDSRMIFPLLQDRAWQPDHQLIASFDPSKTLRSFYAGVSRTFVAYDAMVTASKYFENSVIIEKPRDYLKGRDLATFNEGWSRLGKYMRLYSEIYKGFSGINAQTKVQVLQTGNENIDVNTQTILKNLRARTWIYLALHIGYGIEDHLEEVIVKKSRQNAVKSGLEKLYEIKKSPVGQIKGRVRQLVASSTYKKMKSVLSKVDKPDSGDIEGSKSEFEAVMRTQIGFEIINYILTQVLK